jgi:DNA-binding NarL/FixJ family response regulator
LALIATLASTPASAVHSAELYRAQALFYGLSNREVEILHLIAKGKTNKEIGCVLGISARTVQVHASRAYDKVGAYNRAGATLWLAEHRGRLD